MLGRADLDSCNGERRLEGRPLCCYLSNPWLVLFDIIPLTGKKNGTESLSLMLLLMASCVRLAASICVCLFTTFSLGTRGGFILASSPVMIDEPSIIYRAGRNNEILFNAEPNVLFLLKSLDT